MDEEEEGGCQCSADIEGAVGGAAAASGSRGCWCWWCWEEGRPV